MLFEVYDIETLSNLFTYTGYDINNKSWHQFVICPWRDDTELLYNHLFRDKLMMIGYNNEGFDYPIIHHLINHFKEYKDISSSEVAQKLYKKAQEIINQEFSTIADKNKFIKQIDLYKIHGYDNEARRCSLKDLEIAMRMDSVEEMPIDHTKWCFPGDEELVLSYNKNDVLATYEFFKITIGKTDNPIYADKNKIELRQELQKQFGINVLNTPDIRIGEQLMLKLYSNATGVPINVLKKCGGSPREIINVKDCIPHWANFETKEFQGLKNYFENVTVLNGNLKGSLSKSVIFHGIKIDYGSGGAHSSIEPGIYEEDDYWMILDEDIGSLYPSIAIQLGIFPEHLGPTFRELYDKDIVSVRLAEKKKPKKERKMTIMEGFKLAANSIYGKSNEANSAFYDPLYTLKTTIGGQMFLSLWTEKLVKAIPEIRFISHNTDGILYMLPKKDYDKAIAVGQEMSELTGLFIEDNTYKKVIQNDVNNYIAVYSDHSPEEEHLKLKGCFEIDKEFHKDSSMRIVPIALKEYFVNGIPIEQTIMNHTDIFDFCLRLKTNSKSTPYYKYLNDGKIINQKLNRTTRYYISNNGGILIKEFDKNRNSGVNVGYNVTLFNKYIKKSMSEYDLNYNFYIAEAYKIKNSVDNGQLKLF